MARKPRSPTDRPMTARRGALPPGYPDIACLSFVAMRDGKTLPKPTGDQCPRCFWNVKATGDFEKDCDLGDRLAREYLAFEQTAMAAANGPGHLQHIVGDMPRPLTRVEVNFLIMVSYAAAAGAARLL